MSKLGDNNEKKKNCSRVVCNDDRGYRCISWSMNVNAATKKITVDQTYENATKIKGKPKRDVLLR